MGENDRPITQAEWDAFIKSMVDILYVEGMTKREWGGRLLLLDAALSAVFGKGATA